MTKYFVSLALFLSVSFTTGFVFAADQYNPTWFANDVAQRGLIQDYSSTPEKYKLSEFITKREVLQMSLKIIAKKVPKEYVCKGYMKHPKMLKGEKSQLCGIIEKAIDAKIITKYLVDLSEPMDSQDVVVALARAVDFDFPLSLWSPEGPASKLSKGDIVSTLDRYGMFPQVSGWEYGGLHMYQNLDYQGFLTRDDTYRLLVSLFSGFSVSDDEYVIAQPYNKAALLFPGGMLAEITVPDNTSASSGQILFMASNKVYVTFTYDFGRRFPGEQAIDNLYEIDLNSKEIKLLFSERSTYNFTNGRMVYVSNNSLVVHTLLGETTAYLLPEELQDKLIADIAINSLGDTISFTGHISEDAVGVYDFDIQKKLYTIKKKFGARSLF